jgi:hypothetical protein
MEQVGPGGQRNTTKQEGAMQQLLLIKDRQAPRHSTRHTMESRERRQAKLNESESDRCDSPSGTTKAAVLEVD